MFRCDRITVGDREGKPAFAKMILWLWVVAVGRQPPGHCSPCVAVLTRNTHTHTRQSTFITKHKGKYKC